MIKFKEFWNERENFMIQTNCSKCDGELVLHDGYGVCSKCGEIIGFDVFEEKEEIVEEIFTSPQPAEEIIPEEIEEIPEEIFKTEEDIVEETVEEAEEIAVAEETEETEETKGEVIINEETATPKKKKTPIVILIIVVLCILALLGGYFISKVNRSEVDNETENVEQEDIIEEEPKAIDEEPEEVQIQQEVEKEETVVTEHAPVKQETPKKQTVKKEDAVISPTPSISYRIRKSADDSDTQIGAFSDLERAKAFAANHSADGYKVYDMNGNVVFEP